MCGGTEVASPSSEGFWAESSENLPHGLRQLLSPLLLLSRVEQLLLCRVKHLPGRGAGWGLCALQKDGPHVPAALLSSEFWILSQLQPSLSNPGQGSWVSSSCPCYDLKGSVPAFITFSLPFLPLSSCSSQPSLRHDHLFCDCAFCSLLLSSPPPATCAP